MDVTLPSIDQREKLTNTRATDFFYMELPRQFQPLAYRPMPDPNGAPRSLQRERRNVVVRVRDCRMTKIQACIFGMQTQQDVSYSDMLAVKKFGTLNV